MVLLSCHQLIWTGAKCNNIALCFLSFNCNSRRSSQGRPLEICCQAATREKGRLQTGGAVALQDWRFGGSCRDETLWWQVMTRVMVMVLSCHHVMAGWWMANSLLRMFQGYWQCLGVRVEREQGVQRRHGGSNSKRISVMVQESDVSKHFDTFRTYSIVSWCCKTFCECSQASGLCEPQWRRVEERWQAMAARESRCVECRHAEFSIPGHSELPLQIRNTSRHAMVWHNGRSNVLTLGVLFFAVFLTLCKVWRQFDSSNDSSDSN